MQWAWDALHIVWLSGIALHLVLLAVLFACERIRRFPLFSLYVLYFLIRSLGLFVVAGYVAHGSLSTTAQNHLSIGFALADILLEIAVLIDLAAKGLRGAGYPPAKILAGTLIGLLAALSLPLFWGRWPSLVSPGVDGIDWQTLTAVAIGKGNLFVQSLAIVVAFAVLVSSSRTGLRWTSHVRRILQGLSAYAIVRIVITLIIPAIEKSIKQPTSMAEYQAAMIKLRYIQNLQYITLGTYLLAVVYWIVTMWLPDGPVPPTATVEAVPSIEPGDDAESLSEQEPPAGE